MNEDQLIPRLLEAARAAGAATAGPEVVLGPGDDAAVLAPRAGEELVWTVDDQVESSHFERAWGWEEIGTKAAGACLSDLAAMGARPVGALLSLHLPADLDPSAVLALARGVGRGLGRARCPLLGGNLARAARVALSVSALGAVAAGRALRRDAARPGDLLLVGGALGLARLGLAHLLGGGEPRDAVARPLLEPTPLLELGRAVATLPRAACMDVSDGLARDLPRLLRASGVAAVVDSAALPAPPADLVARLAPGATPAEVAWLGGEDYALLVAAPDASGLPLVPIGRVVAGPPGAIALEGPLAGRDLGEGFDHFG